MKTMSSSQTQPQRKFRSCNCLLAAAVSSCFAASVAWANPVAPTVVNGAATFSQTGNVLTVTNTNGAIINWNKFSIGSGETTYFLQSSASSSVLNRVLSSDPSVILGTLGSNGKVWLINPAGIMVGAGARVDVAGFVASTLNVSDANFLAGKLLFDATPGAGSVVNQGAITTPSGGSVYLIAPNVQNAGVITTPGGETILAAGQTVALLDTGTPGVKVEITGAEGNATNLGTILADAGRIGMAGVLVRNSGTLNASSVVNEGGRIFLKASQDAYVDGNGRIVTTGTKGGSVEVLGNRVAVMDNASIDASGENGGGTVLIGGDYQGKNADIQNSQSTYFGPNASIKANATDNGNGGKVIVWADNDTGAFGNIEAKGGAKGGDGGFVETSGHNFLNFNARVDTTAAKGKVGTLLLDPDTVDIFAGAGTDTYGGANFTWDGYRTALYGGSGASVIYGANLATLLNSTGVWLTTSGTTTTGNITVHAGTYNLGNGSYDLGLLAYGGGSATGNITFQSGVNLSMNGGLYLLAGWDGTGLGTSATPTVTPGKGTISFTDSNVSSTGPMGLYAGANINLTASASSVSVTSQNTTSGMIVNAGGTLKLQAANSGNYGGATLASYGGQNITANRIELYGGTTGHDNAASIINISSSNSQIIAANSIFLKAGGSGANDFNNRASIESSNAGQYISITGSNGSIVLYGGSGGDHASAYGGVAGAYYGGDCALYGGINYCYESNNAAEIMHRDTTGSYGQTISFSGSGGVIALYGGSGGAGNTARIANQVPSNIGSVNNQYIGDSVHRPDIYLQGGSSGGKVVYGSDGQFYDMRSLASIESDSAAMTAYAGNITMLTGGGMSGAFIGGGPQSGGGVVNINASGNVIMTGGSSGPVVAMNNSAKTFDFSSPVGIGSDKDVTVNLMVGGDLTLNSGSNTSGKAMIGSLEGVADVTVTAMGNITLNSTGAGVGIGSHADAAKGQHGGGYISVHADGDIVLNGSASNNFGAMIGSKDDSGSSQVNYVPTDVSVYVSAGHNVTMNGGGGLGALIGIKTPTHSGNTVYVSAGYPYGGNISMSNNAYIKAGEGTYGGSVSLLARASSPTGTTGNIAVDKVLAGDDGSNGYISISADRAILDNNGNALNAIARNISLSSYYGGQPSGLAISLDTQASNNLYATVNWCDCYAYVGGYGGVSIRNFSTLAPSLVRLWDYDTYGGNISFFNQASMDSNILDINTRTGDVFVATGGNLNLSGWNVVTGVGKSAIAAAAGDITASASSIYAYDINDGDSGLQLGAGGNIVLTNSSISGSFVNLVAGNSVQISSSDVVATAGNLQVVAPTITINGSYLSAYGNLTMLANNIQASNYSAMFAGYDYWNDEFANPNGNVTMTVSGDIRLNNYVFVAAGNDVTFNLQGSNSTLYLNELSGYGPVFVLSDVATWIPATTHVNFLTRTSGGIVIDGVNTSKNSSSGSGFYALDMYTSATQGFGLDISYPATDNPVVKTITDVFNNTTDKNNLSDNATKASSTTLVLKPVGANTTNNQTVGGDSDDSFGGGEKDDNQKDKNNGKPTSKNQCS